MGLISINKYGRKPGFIGFMLLCGITCILCGYAENVLIQVSLFLIGKFGISASFSIIYVHAVEIMPKPIRSSTLGFFASMCRFGALLAPFSSFLEKYYKPLPYICFGLSAIFGGLIYVWMPETLNKKLPNTDTVKEASRKKFIDSPEEEEDDENLKSISLMQKTSSKQS